eukprot:TRINITY_DN4812_c0_g1_i1.p1 TRINITY_DN4812_c0_g1~~TRINITY_DN4812_c0_g1_i1.p1  ORF type:complete len:144 (+),score=12.71 TRINITY_DN4812_c0_g1_i1:132-563(+)
MDEPIFGEESKSSKWMKYLSIFAITVVVLATCIFSFLQGLPYQLFIGTVVTLVALILILINWYKAGDLDPKFKPLIGFAIVILMYLCLSTLYIIFFMKIDGYYEEGEKFVCEKAEGDDAPEMCIVVLTAGPKCVDCKSITLSS